MSMFEEAQELRVALFALMLAVLLVGLPGNTIICHTFRQNCSLRTVTNLIIINMAATAIAHCLLNIPISLVYLTLDYWPFGSIYCKVNGFTNSVCLFESMFSLVVLSGSRYWCIIHPTTFQAIFSKRRTLFMIGLSWLLTFALSSPLLFGWYENRHRVGKMSCVSLWGLSTTYTIFIAITVFLLPSLVILAVYFKIYKHIKSHERLIKLYTFVAAGPVCGLGSTAATSTRRKHFTTSIFKDYQVTKLIWALFVIFIASWVPYFGVNLIYESVGRDIPRSLDAILAWTTTFNTACSPIIYGLVNRQFRKSFWEGIGCCKRRLGTSARRHWQGGTRAYPDSTDMRSSFRTYAQTSRIHVRDMNVNGIVICVSTV